MKTGLLSLVLLATTLLTGCDASAKSIDWYKAHDVERKVKYEECTKVFDPRSTEESRNNPEKTNVTDIGPIVRGRYFIVERPSGGRLGPFR